MAERLRLSIIIKCTLSPMVESMENMLSHSVSFIKKALKLLILKLYAISIEMELL